MSMHGESNRVGIEGYVQDLRARQARIRPEGTPHEVVYPLGERTLPAYLDEWARLQPDKNAIVFDGGALTYTELAGHVSHLAGWLESIGISDGDRVAVYLPNTPQFIISMLAILRAGAVHVPVNPMFRAAELAHELEDSGAAVVVTLEEFLPRLEEVSSTCAISHVLVTTVGEMGTDEEPPSLPAPDEKVTRWSDALTSDPGSDRSGSLDALAVLNYTGGTTGLPKGCRHTHRNLMYTAATAIGATGWKPGADYVTLCYIPIFWIAGEDLGVLMPLVAGGTGVVLGRWDCRKVLDAIETHGVTIMVGTVENYQELLAQPDIKDRDLSSFTDPTAVSFVQKLTVELRHEWTSAVGEHSCLREGGYGMTETHTYDAVAYHFNTDDRDLRSEPVFCGIPVPGTDIAVVSFETGEPLSLGEVGEIIVRTPSMMDGYWNKPEATAEQLRDGWLHTGDHGRLSEDGCLHYLGRAKEMIKVKGMSVFPAEVETLLCRHAEVRVAAVIADEHPEKGQQPVAFIKLEEGSMLTPDELQDWAKGNMATYKVPTVRIVEEFPMTATGKIRKPELAGLLRSEPESGMDAVKR